jgi:hypothetical protein
MISVVNAKRHIFNVTLSVVNPNVITLSGVALLGNLLSLHPLGVRNIANVGSIAA